MNLNLENGEMISITTPYGLIVINSDSITQATLVSVSYHEEGYKVTPSLVLNKETGQEECTVWIEPVTADNP